MPIPSSSPRSSWGRRLLLLALTGCASLTGCAADSNPGAPPAEGGGTGGRGGSGTGGKAGTGAGGTGGTGSGGLAGAPGEGGSGPAGQGGGASAGQGGSSDAGATGGAGGSAVPDAGGLSDASPTGHAFKITGAATWRGNATAAYTLIHDDICDPSVHGAIAHADPMLVERGLHGGFGVIVSRCSVMNRWDEVKSLIAHGHDVFDHSWNHPCMTMNAALAMSCDPAAPHSADYATEIDMSTKVLREQTGVPNVFFIFPYDVCDPAGVARLKTQGYLGARCGDQTTQFNPSNFTDPFKIQFDVWGPAYSHYGPAYAMTPVCQGVKEYETPPPMAPAGCRATVLKQYVDDTITRKGWAVREFHGFTDDPSVFEALSVEDYKTHLDYLTSKVASHDLWVEGPTPVLKYRFAREKCPLPSFAGGSLKFAAPSDECSKYATVVSYLVATSDGSDPASLAVRQGGVMLPGRKLGPGSFVVDADPSKGDAQLVE